MEYSWIFYSDLQWMKERSKDDINQRISMDSHVDAMAIHGDHGDHGSSARANH